MKLPSLPYIATLLTLVTGVSAAPLPLDSTLPVINYNSNGTTVYTYDAQTERGMFTADAMPLTLDTPSGTFFFNFASENFLHLEFQVDADGVLVGGPAVTDFEITGEVDLDGDFVFETTGLLLKGEITQFGSEDGGATDLFDLRVTVTGGAMASLYAGKDLGVNLTMESNSSDAVSFTDDFSLAFNGGAKGNVGGIEKLPAGQGVGGVVFCDTDGDGILDPDEVGVAGVKILLTSEGPDHNKCRRRDNTRMRVETDENGVFLFEQVPVGEELEISIGRFAHLPKGTKLSPGSSSKYTLTLNEGEARLDLSYALLCPTASYCVREAIACDSLSGFALSLPGIGTDFVFKHEHGELYIYPNGSALISGVVESKSNIRKSFGFLIELSGATTNPNDPSLPSGSPRIEIQAGQCGLTGPLDTSAWVYYANFDARLVGRRSFDGAVLDLDSTGPAFQIGAGANGKNLTMGGLSSFTWQVERQKRYCGLPVTGCGEFRFDFVTCPSGHGHCD